jgi:DNA mismatch repair protein MutL
MAKIQVLSQKLANQIAAGEVIERPASVVKELLENALDAGATQIHIDVRQGGRQAIRITDNGCGIPKEELALALSRHATSKITSLSDLAQIQSLGFRGEALASIASVSRLRLISRPQTQAHAWQVQVAGQDMQAEVTPASHDIGTTLEVCDLFYNTPARRKFLRSDKTEWLRIEEVVKRFALSHFQLGLKLMHNQRVILQVAPAQEEIQQEQRVKKIFGQTFLQHALHFTLEKHGFHLSGWLGLPTFTRSQADLQAFFVNQRMVRDKVINHAIRQAYAEHLPEGRYAAYILSLSLPPQSVDVNVHPTKHEVRFHEARMLHDFITHSLQQVLQQPLPTAPTQAAKPKPPSANVIELASVNYDTARNASYKAHKKVPIATRQIREQIIDYAALIGVEAEQTTPASNDAMRPHTIIGWAKPHYVLFETQQGIVVANVAKVCATQLQQQWQAAAKPLVQKPLLFPCVIQVTDKQHAYIQAQQAELSQLGIELNQAGPNSYVLRQLPKSDIPLNPQMFCDQLLASQLSTAQEWLALLAQCVDITRIKNAPQPKISEWVVENYFNDEKSGYTMVRFSDL